MELSRLKDEDGDVHSVLETSIGSHVIRVGHSDDDTSEAYRIDARDALRLIDAAGANTTANDLRAKLEESDKERYAAIREMAKARRDAQEAESQAMLYYCILGEEAEARGGQFKRMFDEWSKRRRELDDLRQMNLNLLDEAKEYQQTIASLRQRDTVRPEALVEESLPLPEYVRQKQSYAWLIGYRSGDADCRHDRVGETNNPYGEP